MKKIVFILIATLMIFSLVACGAQGDGNEKPAAHTLSFKEGKMVTMNESEYIGLFFEYTNNSGETALPCEAIDVKAFQNGKQLNIVVYTGQKTEGAIQCDTAVQSGTTTDVVWTFEKEDDSTISVECTDGQKFEVTIN